MAGRGILALIAAGLEVEDICFFSGVEQGLIPKPMGRMEALLIGRGEALFVGRIEAFPSHEPFIIRRCSTWRGSRHKLVKPATANICLFSNSANGARNILLTNASLTKRPLRFVCCLHKHVRRDRNMEHEGYILVKMKQYLTLRCSDIDVLGIL